MPAAEAPAPFTLRERDHLFRAFLNHDRILLAVSGGPDSTALMVLAHDWRMARGDGPALEVATVDHGLRPESRAEAAEVGALCRRLGLPWEMLHWAGEKPATGIQEAARTARYDLLAGHARRIGADAVALAHTLDDQAETVLFRLARGSGLPGLSAMKPVSRRSGLDLLRPFLDVPKARLVAFLEGRGLAFARDPGNGDARFARPRLRALAPLLAGEGLDAARLARFAERVARVEAAIAAAVDVARHACLKAREDDHAQFDAPLLFAQPDEISLRLLIAEVARLGTEGTPELGKAERLHAALKAAFVARNPCTRTLAGALVRLKGHALSVTGAPERRKKPAPLASNSPR